MPNWPDIPFDQTQLESYLTDHYKVPVQVQDVRPLKDDTDPNQTIKSYGYGSPLLITFSQNGTEQRLVLHTMSSDRFGHNRRSDRARNLLLDYDNFNHLPQHVPALDVGAFERDGGLISLGHTGEFFLTAPFITGQLYAADLMRIAEDGQLGPHDEARALALADYLAEIHAHKDPDPVRYKRAIRDLLGHGEGIMGMTDSYPADTPVAPPERLEFVEHQCLRWRWRIRERADRLSQSHGDFHPWNVLFDVEQAADDPRAFTMLDRSRGAWGEPADDLSAMTINYILFSVRQHGRLEGVWAYLFQAFWERYLAASGDGAIQEVIAPFYAWRALVVAHPVWYPDLDDTVRETLFQLIENVLAVDRFVPMHVNGYLGR